MLAAAGEAGIAQQHGGRGAGGSQQHAIDMQAGMRAAGGAKQHVELAVQEFGHVIGLPHSGLKTDIMFPVASTANLSERDRASAMLLYSLPPGSLKEPPSR